MEILETKERKMNKKQRKENLHTFQDITPTSSQPFSLPLPNVGTDEGVTSVHQKPLTIVVTYRFTNKYRDLSSTQF